MHHAALELQPFTQALELLLDFGPALRILEHRLEASILEFRYRGPDQVGQGLIGLLDHAIADDCDTFARRLEDQALHLHGVTKSFFDREALVGVFVDADVLGFAVARSHRGDVQLDVDHGSVGTLAPNDARLHRPASRVARVVERFAPRRVVGHQHADAATEQILLVAIAEKLQQRFVAHHDQALAHDDDAEWRRVDQCVLLERHALVIDAS